MLYSNRTTVIEREVQMVRVTGKQRASLRGGGGVWRREGGKINSVAH